MENENPFHPGNPENPENPDSDKFHQHWHGKRNPILKNLEILKILIQTNFTNIGTENENLENPGNPENPDSDKFHQHWHVKCLKIRKILKILEILKILIQTNFTNIGMAKRKSFSS